MHSGIDEAGRGPVLGPLVVAGVAGDPATLRGLGCRDSKELPASRRQQLHRHLQETGTVIVVRQIEAEDLDAARRRHTLNAIEADLFRDVAQGLSAAGATRVHCDAADTDAQRFARTVQEGVGVPVTARHRADADDPCVAAASIVAKVTRDAAVAALGRRLERRLPMPLGSGYPSDPLTRAFLVAWRDRFGDLPEGTRRSWRTAKALLAPRPSRLDAFG